MYAYNYQPTAQGATFSEYDFLRKYQSTDESVKLRNAKRELTHRGITVGELFSDRWSTGLVTQEAIQTLGDNPSHWLPDIILDQILETTALAQSAARTIARVVTAPAGQPQLYWREYSRWQRPQIVGETDQIQAPRCEKATHSLEFYTIGDRVIHSWQEIKDSPIDVLAMDNRAMGAMFGQTEMDFVTNSLYQATSGANALAYENFAQVMLASNEDVPFQVFGRYACDMSAPTADSHPNTDPTIRRALLNVYRPNVCLVTPPIWRSLIASWQSALTGQSIASNLVWTNGTRILENGALDVPLYGMQFYRINSGYWHENNPMNEWVETNSCYLIDNRLGGSELWIKEPMQVNSFDTYERRINNLQIWERLNAVVRNPRSVYRLDFSDEYGAPIGE